MLAKVTPCAAPIGIMLRSQKLKVMLLPVVRADSVLVVADPCRSNRRRSHGSTRTMMKQMHEVVTRPKADRKSGKGKSSVFRIRLFTSTSVGPTIA